MTLRLPPLLILAAAARAASPSEGLSSRWLTPPIPVAEVRAAGWREVRFEVDGRGRPWVLHDRSELVCPTEKASLRLVTEADGFAYAGNPSPLLSAGGYLGTVPPVAMVRSDADGIPVLPFKPVRRMPRPECSISSGAGGVLYALCGGELFRLRRSGQGASKTRFEPVLAAPEPVSAAAGDGREEFVALGAVVLRLSGGKAVPLFRHPSARIRDLAYAPGVGLFYATDDEAGFWDGARARALRKVAKPRVRVHDGALFVFSEEDFGVLRLEGLDSLKTP